MLGEIPLVVVMVPRVNCRSVYSVSVRRTE